MTVSELLLRISEKYQDDIERAGGVYLIARDFDSFVEWFDKYIQEWLK